LFDSQAIDSHIEQAISEKSCGYVLQDLDAVEALIQGLVLFQGGVLMVSIIHSVTCFVNI